MATADAERHVAAILYTELRNFTRLSEVLPPHKVLELANDFFSFCAMAVTANKGKVLSVQNDMLVAAFAAAERKDFARRALKAAQDVRREFGGVSDQWKTQYGLPAAVSSALHLGEAVFGMGGPIGARQFVAFGDCVSVCERLVHRARHGEIIMSLDVVKAIGADVVKELGAEGLPALEIPKRPPIPIYGLPIETRLDFT
jgi:adenylate cyclase